MARILALLVTILLMGIEQAHAGWEWAQWGMTPDQAQAASGGKAVTATTAEKQRRTYRKNFVPIRIPELVAGHQMAGSDFQAYLLFDVNSTRLVCVDLVTKTAPGQSLASVPTNPALKPALTASYGKPADEKRQQLPGVEWTTTTWITDNETVELQQGGLGTKIQYCQRDQGQVAAR